MSKYVFLDKYSSTTVLDCVGLGDGFGLGLKSDYSEPVFTAD